MESPDAISNISSPEPAQDRSVHPKLPVPDGVDKSTTYIKFLVSHSEAGCVIGKGGTTITDFQTQSRARIQLSRNLEFFPGTSDRIIMVSGIEDEVLQAMSLILAKLLSEIQIEDEGENTETAVSKVRLIVPNSSCGGIIGKAGSTIRSFIQDSHAGIKISPQDNGYYGVSDRVVTLSGSLEEMMRAIKLILYKLIDDPHYSQSMNGPFPYAASYSRVTYGPNGGGGSITGKFQNGNGQQNESLTVGIADEHVGLVVGRRGRTIMEIGQVSGARIKVSDRGDFIAGTTDRKVTITGSDRAIRTAQSLIMERVASAVEQSCG